MMFDIIFLCSILARVNSINVGSCDILNVGTGFKVEYYNNSYLDCGGTSCVDYLPSMEANKEPFFSVNNVQNVTFNTSGNPQYQDFFGKYVNVYSFGLRITAYFHAPEDGTYSFVFDGADDAASLYLGTDVGSDCCGEISEISGSSPKLKAAYMTEPTIYQVTLKAGYYPMKVLYVNYGYLGALNFYVTNPDGSRASSANMAVMAPLDEKVCVVATTTITSSWTQTFATTITNTPTQTGEVTETVIVDFPPLSTTTISGTAPSTYTTIFTSGTVVSSEVVVVTTVSSSSSSITFSSSSVTSSTIPTSSSSSAITAPSSVITLTTSSSSARSSTVPTSSLTIATSSSSLRSSTVPTSSSTSISSTVRSSATLTSSSTTTDSSSSVRSSATITSSLSSAINTSSSVATLTTSSSTVRSMTTNTSPSSSVVSGSNLISTYTITMSSPVDSSFASSMYTRISDDGSSSMAGSSAAYITSSTASTIVTSVTPTRVTISSATSSLASFIETTASSADIGTTASPSDTSSTLDDSSKPSNASGVPSDEITSTVDGSSVAYISSTVTTSLSNTTFGYGGSSLTSIADSSTDPITFTFTSDISSLADSNISRITTGIGETSVQSTETTDLSSADNFGAEESYSTSNLWINSSISKTDFGGFSETTWLTSNPDETALLTTVITIPCDICDGEFTTSITRTISNTEDCAATPGSGFNVQATRSDMFVLELVSSSTSATIITISCKECEGGDTPSASTYGTLVTGEFDLQFDGTRSEIVETAFSGTHEYTITGNPVLESSTSSSLFMPSAISTYEALQGGASSNAVTTLFLFLSSFLWNA